MPRLFILLVVFVCHWPLSSQAGGDLLMARSLLPFPEAMLALQDSIRGHGYTVTRVQRVDIGLTGRGYQTDKYRLVFFGKYEEIRALADAVPELITYLPPKISIFAEGEQTILVMANPELYADIAKGAIDPVIFDRWKSDFTSILDDVSSAR